MKIKIPKVKKVCQHDKHLYYVIGYGGQEWYCVTCKQRIA